ncbi:hypothetical protein BJP34_25825 [Moorena producens PAL-8-15-08-1]|uniref:Uncharacterized protein n=1 Tax=Moorena producens PAL-8-15-08-1 TaxID=1458985 RepID=A0A1D8TXU6_9CYAN|nr:hypothetical protein BJP34_25825 [Moorena producens PAL-8-15-08-1]
MLPQNWGLGGYKDCCLQADITKCFFRQQYQNWGTNGGLDVANNTSQTTSKTAEYWSVKADSSVNR